tara:strand:+ start:1158 stop:1295 length:138 start_codon:yes stop_codon:yes gene_type:complete
VVCYIVQVDAIAENKRTKTLDNPALKEGKGKQKEKVIWKLQCVFQ